MKVKKVKGYDLKQSPYETFKVHQPALILFFETKYLIGGLIRRYKRYYDGYSDEDIKKFINAHIDEELNWEQLKKPTST